MNELQVISDHIAELRAEVVRLTAENARLSAELEIANASSTIDTGKLWRAVSELKKWREE